MRNIRNAFGCARINFLKWRGNLMVVLLLLMWVLYIVLQTRPLTAFCMENDYVITPWVLHMLGVTPQFISTILYITLFSHAPFSSQTVPFTMIRTGKRTWLIGQVVYIVAASFVLVLLTYVSMLITLSPCLGFSAGWGGVLTGLSQDSSMLYKVECLLYSNRAVINRYSAIEGTLIAFGVRWLNAVLVGTMVLFFNTVVRRGSGLTAAVACAAFSLLAKEGAGLVMGLTGIKKMAVFFWGDLNNLSPIDPKGIDIRWAVIIQLLLIAAFILCSIIAFCKKDTQFDTDEFS